MEHFNKRTWAEIDLNNVEYNFNAIKKSTTNGAKTCCVIKADAYGHGAVKLGKFYETLGADFFAVATFDEAVELRTNGITKPILILGYTPVDCAKTLCELNLSQSVYSKDYAFALLDECKKAGVKIKVHIKIDTGMGRIGFICRDKTTKNLESIVDICKSGYFINEGIFTHFSKADEGEMGKNHTKNQLENLLFAIDYLKQNGVEFQIRHSANSAAIFDYPESHLDMVRAGISLYGFAPSYDMFNVPNLKPAMNLKTVVTNVKILNKDEIISYGGEFKATKPIKVASLAVGYADGFWRSNYRTGYKVKINGEYCSILGRICMDQLMVDVSNVNCKIGDEVLLFGDDKLCLAHTIATLNKSIDHEIVTSVTKRVPRIYVR